MEKEKLISIIFIFTPFLIILILVITYFKKTKTIFNIFKKDKK